MHISGAQARILQRANDIENSVPIMDNSEYLREQIPATNSSINIFDSSLPQSINLQVTSVGDNYVRYNINSSILDNLPRHAKVSLVRNFDGTYDMIINYNNDINTQNRTYPPNPIYSNRSNIGLDCNN